MDKPIATPPPATTTAKTDVETLKQRILAHLKHTVGKNPQTTTDLDWYHAIAQTVRDELVDDWLNTFSRAYDQDTKRVYYFSLEFLIGRSLINNLIYIGQYEMMKQVLAELEEEYGKTYGRKFDLDLERLSEQEAEAALGNGGLGRLAACIMDSLATQEIPGYGYGIRYDFGMFRQMIDERGEQVEFPDNWLRYRNPWEFERPEFSYPVRFFGRCVEFQDDKGKLRVHWVDTEEVLAVAHDLLIPGYGRKAVNHIRLWKGKSPRDFDLKRFNRGNYIEAVHHRSETETLSRVLYPDDSTYEGKALRLRQEFFFCSASLQDIIRRYLSTHDDIRGLPEKVAIQLNDTHPAVGIAELMRLLLDEHGLDWTTAWDITGRTFSYTNHTLLPEALEIWPAALFEHMLPRHLRIIQDINHRFLQDVMHKHPGDFERMRRLSIFSEEGEKSVRMGHLAFIAGHKVNGVAAIHTELMKKTIFTDLHAFMPNKITNKTNGITPRRWLLQANMPLAKLITSHIGDKWITHLGELHHLVPLAEDKKFRKAFQDAKRQAKVRLVEYVKRFGMEMDVDTMFDVHVKRMHEYKRQLLNILHVITRYNRIKANPSAEWVPRTVIFAGKAAPAYYVAKVIINLINNVADIINNDPQVNGRLKVFFIPNYNVSNAEKIMPAADLSEQISTAGTEASGTGNMKFSLNGALTIGTRDGANIEIAEEVGEENIFFFGLSADEAAELRYGGTYSAWEAYNADPELKQVLDMIRGGYFSPDDPARFLPIWETLIDRNDHFLLLADYRAYVECQEKVDALYKDPEEWTRKAIINTANMGKFSIDRTVMDYAQEIWNVKPLA